MLGLGLLGLGLLVSGFVRVWVRIREGPSGRGSHCLRRSVHDPWYGGSMVSLSTYGSRYPSMAPLDPTAPDTVFLYTYTRSIGRSVAVYVVSNPGPLQVS